MSEIAVHPVSAIFPDLTDDEYRALRDSIRTNGVLAPVVVDELGRVIDGRHRAKAALELGVPYETQILVGPTAWEYARTINLDRRHLSEQQRAAVLLKAEQEGLAPEVTAIRADAKKRKRATQAKRGEGKVGGVPQHLTEVGKTSDQVGALVSVSGDTIRRVETAAKVGGKDALDRIESGQATAQEILKEADKRAAKTIKSFSGRPAVYDDWRKAWKAIDGKVGAEAINGSAHHLSATEIDLIASATPRMIAALQEFHDAVVGRQMTVIQGGR